MIFTIGCFCSVSKSGQTWQFPVSAKLTSESGKMWYTKVVEDFLSFSKMKGSSPDELCSSRYNFWKLLHLYCDIVRMGIMFGYFT